MIEKIPDSVFIGIFLIIVLLGFYVQAESYRRGIPFDRDWAMAMVVGVIGLGLTSKWR